MIKSDIKLTNIIFWLKKYLTGIYGITNTTDLLFSAYLSSFITLGGIFVFKITPIIGCLFMLLFFYILGILFKNNIYPLIKHIRHDINNQLELKRFLVERETQLLVSSTDNKTKNVYLKL